VIRKKRQININMKIKSTKIKMTAIIVAVCIIASMACVSCNKKSEKKVYNVSDIPDFTEEAMVYLQKIGTDFSDRDADTEGIKAAREWISEELHSAGYEVIQDAFTEDGTNYCNIIVEKEGRDKNRQVIVGAHYDGTGLGDNGSGVALLLAAAVGLKNVSLPCNVVFIFFDGEEYGLYGSSHYAGKMSSAEKKKTLFMVNIDSLAFGDYCNVYGGNKNIYSTWNNIGNTLKTYEFVFDLADAMGIKTWGIDDLDGYFAEHGTGPEITDNTIYTNPWTRKNPAPENSSSFSPNTIPYSDQVGFAKKGIPYIYFEATNWFAGVKGTDLVYTGYIETYDSSLGEDGMFMNTEYDTLDNLEQFFPGRCRKHFQVYSPLLNGILLNADRYIK
jgi:hypothetical protein